MPFKAMCQDDISRLAEHGGIHIGGDSQLTLEPCRQRPWKSVLQPLAVRALAYVFESVRSSQAGLTVAQLKR